MNRKEIAKALAEKLVASVDVDGMPIISGINAATTAIITLRASAAPEEGGERDDSWVLDIAKELSAVLVRKYSNDGLWRNLHAEEIVKAIDGFLFIRPAALSPDSRKAEPDTDWWSHLYQAALRANEKLDTSISEEWIQTFIGETLVEPRDGMPRPPHAALAPATEDGTAAHLRQIRAFASVINQRNFLDIALHIGRQADEALSLTSAQSNSGAK